MKISNEKTENGFKFTLESSAEELESIKEVFAKMFKTVPNPLGVSFGDVSEQFEKIFKVAQTGFSVEQDVLQYKDMLFNGIDALVKQTKENGTQA